MIGRTVMAWALCASALAYNPAPTEILSRMETALRRADPVQARVIRRDAEGMILEETVLTVPAKAEEAPEVSPALGIPFASLTMPAEAVERLLPSLFAESTTVALDRIDGTVCYLIEGEGERMWVSKGDLLPLRIETSAPEMPGTAYLYLNMVSLSETVRYPARTEVWRDGELILVEELQPAPADTTRP